MRTNSIGGFTLIELMVTLAILAVLVTVVVPLADVIVQRSKEQELRLALRQIRDGLDAYKRASDEGRITKSIDDSGYPESLEKLVDGIVDIKDPKKRKIFFMRRIPRDPMYENRSASPAETWGKRSYQSTANDPQEGEDVFDVYSLSNNIGLNGIPYKEW